MKLSLFTFMVSSISFALFKSHILNMLLSMEMATVATILLILSKDTFSSNTQIMFILMAFMVAESATAMSLVTKMAKAKGTQSIKFM